ISASLLPMWLRSFSVRMSRQPHEVAQLPTSTARRLPEKLTQDGRAKDVSRPATSHPERATQSLSNNLGDTMSAQPTSLAGTLPSGAIETDIPARLDRLPWTRFHWLLV